MKIRLQRVYYMPKNLEEGTLYVSEEFGTAAHLCACGCGSKIRTPLGPTEWSLKEGLGGPTLFPSIGNWQQDCKSHYWIRNGKIVWAGKWTPEQIKAGRYLEDLRRKAYFDEGLDSKRKNPIKNFLKILSACLINKCPFKLLSTCLLFYEINNKQYITTPIFLSILDILYIEKLFPQSPSLSPYAPL